MMNIIRYLLLILLIPAFTGCGIWQLGDNPEVSLYCDNFLVYDMCVQDLNRDGVVEFVYFEESNEVFLYREGAQDAIPAELTVHRCAQAMDEGLVATSSRVFFVNESTSYLMVQDIKGAMMIKYIAYMPQVTACNMQAEQDLAGA